LLVLAWTRRWVGGRTAALVISAILVAALPTLSPGLGGIVLALGTAAWVVWRSSLALAVSVIVAAVAVVAMAVTPIIHPTAPFVIHLVGIELAPAGRFLTWSAAVSEFARHPLVGHGIGIDAVQVRYMSPAGVLQQLTDAHNVYLSIAAQTGLIGVFGLAALLAYACRLCVHRRPQAAILAFTFLNAFAYQGLGGSFEDLRHLWVLLGLAAAAGRLDLSRADESSHRAAAPSPC
jgi:O-antigen ligase